MCKVDYVGRSDVDERANLKQHPNQQRLKRQGNRRSIVAGVTGAVVGTCFLGPIGGIVIGGASAVAVKKANKMKRNRLLEQHLRQRQLHDPSHAPIPAKATFATIPSDFEEKETLPVAQPVVDTEKSGSLM